MTKRKIEIFAASCPLCEQAIEKVKKLACASCDIVVYDLKNPQHFQKAQTYGVKRAPAIVVEGKLLSCCAQDGVSEESLKKAGVGKEISA